MDDTTGALESVDNMPVVVPLKAPQTTLIIHYRTTDGEIRGKTSARYYVHERFNDEPDLDWIEYNGDREAWGGISHETHRVDLEKFVVVPFTPPTPLLEHLRAAAALLIEEHYNVIARGVTHSDMLALLAHARGIANSTHPIEAREADKAAMIAAVNAATTADDIQVAVKNIVNSDRVVRAARHVIPRSG